MGVALARKCRVSLLSILRQWHDWPACFHDIQTLDASVPGLLAVSLVNCLQSISYATSLKCPILDLGFLWEQTKGVRLASKRGK